MVELDQFKYTLSTYVPMLKELGASLNLDAKKERIAELSRYMEGFTKQHILSIWPLVSSL